MNITEVKNIVNAMSQRQLGNTTLLAKAVKKSIKNGRDAILVCCSISSAQRISKEYNVPTISLNDLADLSGKNVILVFDNAAIASLSDDANQKQKSQEQNEKPLFLIKVSSDTYKLSVEELDNLRKTMDLCLHDKDFMIFTDYDIKIDKVEPKINPFNNTLHFDNHDNAKYTIEIDGKPIGKISSLSIKKNKE